MASNQLAYIANYNKSNYKTYLFRVKKSNTALTERLDTVRNRNAYITKLIREDVAPTTLTIKQIKERIKPVMQKHGINDVYLFGSYARGEANSSSDVDIYCSSGDMRTLLDEVSLIEEIEAALGKKVDLVTIGSQMHEFFKEQLDKDKIKLW